MKGSTNANVQLPSRIYRASIPDGQTLDAVWAAKWLTVTMIDNGDTALFTPDTNGVQVNRNGIYIVSTGAGFRGGSADNEMILMVSHRRGDTTLTTRNIRGSTELWDSGMAQTVMFNAQAGDKFVLRFNGTSTTIQTMFAPDESHLEVVYIG